MKKIALLLLITLISVKPAFAVIDAGLVQKVQNIEKVQIVDTPTAVPTAKITIVPLRKQIKEIKEIKEASKEAKKEINREKINEHFEIIKESLNNRHEFLVKIKMIVETKLGENLDAKAKFAGLEKLETDYLEDLNNFENKMGEITTSETPGKIIPELRIAVKAVRTDLNSMHKLLADTIKLLVSKP